MVDSGHLLSALSQQAAVISAGPLEPHFLSPCHCLQVPASQLSPPAYLQHIVQHGQYVLDSLVLGDMTHQVQKSLHKLKRQPCKTFLHIPMRYMHIYITSKRKK